MGRLISVLIRLLVLLWLTVFCPTLIAATEVKLSGSRLHMTLIGEHIGAILLLKQIAASDCAYALKESYSVADFWTQIRDLNWSRDEVNELNTFFEDQQEALDQIVSANFAQMRTDLSYLDEKTACGYLVGAATWNHNRTRHNINGVINVRQ